MLAYEPVFPLAAQTRSTQWQGTPSPTSWQQQPQQQPRIYQTSPSRVHAATSPRIPLANSSGQSNSACHVRQCATSPTRPLQQPWTGVHPSHQSHTNATLTLSSNDGRVSSGLEQKRVVSSSSPQGSSHQNGEMPNARTSLFTWQQPQHPPKQEEHQRHQSAQQQSSTVLLPHQSPQDTSEDGWCGIGREVGIDEHRFRCIDVLGRGSYSVVWRAKRLGSSFLGDTDSEVALKEVRCASQGALLQAVFEVQVLLALERAVPHGPQVLPLRVPRCIAYRVDPCQDDGWTVRTAMTVAPGVSLDMFFRQLAESDQDDSKPHVSSEASVRWGCALTRKLLTDIVPVLQLLEPIAWHRDVNAHNILMDGAPDVENATHDGIAQTTTFWLIDFGLAVDSQSWTTSNGRWQTEHIAGDSRYWPPSSWIMHLLGPEGFEERQSLCDQYQRRLDIHGLGVTALELLCSAVSTGDINSSSPWATILIAWQNYWENVWRWWSLVYSVFLQGGDIGPVQMELMREGIIERLDELLEALRQSLRGCADWLVDKDFSTAQLLKVIADMIDDRAEFTLNSLLDALGERVPDTSVSPPSYPVPSVSASAPDLRLASTSAASLGVPAAPENRATTAGPIIRPVGTSALEGKISNLLKLSSVTQEGKSQEWTNLEERIKKMGAFSSKDPNKVENRIKAVEEKLLQLEQQSLERAKLGMEQLAKKYLPKLLAISCAGVVGAGRNSVDSPAPFESDLGNGYNGALAA